MKKIIVTNKEIIKLIETIDKKAKKGNIPKLLPAGATIDERMKYSLCKLFVRYVLKSKIKGSELAALLHLPRTRISDILNYKCESYSVDRLLVYSMKLAEIDPPTREHLNLMFEILSGPVRSVKKTKEVEKILLQKYA